MQTNREFLIAILRSEKFLKGATTTDFIEKEKLSGEVGLSEEEIKNYAKAASLWIQGLNRKNASVLTNMDSGWNNARLPFQEVKLSLRDTNFIINYKKSRDGQFKFSDSELATIYDWQDNFIDVEISGSRLRSKISFEDNLLLIHTYKGDLLFNVLPKFEVKDSGTIEGGLNAPMPGKVVEVQIKKGSSVKKGDTLIILEAMKMEHKVSAPSSGKIKDILVSKGEQVENGQTLVVLD